jgi:uncharacterized protein YjbI with pentapeptide repeats
VRRHVPLLKEDRSDIAHLEEWVTIFLAWWFVPLTLAGFWFRYLYRHEWIGSMLDIVLLAVSVELAIVFYSSSAATLSGLETQTTNRQASGYVSWATGLPAAGSLALILVILSFGAIEGFPGMTQGRDTETVALAGWVPLLKIDIHEADVSTKPPNWTGQENNYENEVALVKGGRLAEANVRYANAEGAFLVKADMRQVQAEGINLLKANLHSADLSFAKLRRANFYQANLQNANLLEADLTGAVLSHATMKNAYLSSTKLNAVKFLRTDLAAARLESVDLSSAEIQGAILRSASLRSVNLRKARFTCVDVMRGEIKERRDCSTLDGAVLDDVNLSGAILIEVINLTQNQLDGACGDRTTKLPPGLTIRDCQTPSEKK